MKVIIIGGGLAGLSLATRLVDESIQVILLERNRFLGGRASNTIDKKMDDPVPIGPHIYLRGYNNYHAFLKKIGAQSSISWERSLFLEIIYNGKHHQFKIKDIPKSALSFHKAFINPFISFRDKISNIYFAFKTHFLSQEEIEKLDGMTAYDYLISCGVTESAINKMWRFFVHSFLNVPIELCSAAELCLFVKYWGSLKNKGIGFSKVGLGDMYTKKAGEFIEKRGGVIRRGVIVKNIVMKDGLVDYLEIEEHGKKHKLKADLFVSSLNPVDLRNVLPRELMQTDFFSGLSEFRGVPYICVNIWLNKKITNKKFWALMNDSNNPKYMNTDFYDKSNIYQDRKDKSYIASNIIYSERYHHLSDAQIIDKTMEELKVAFPRMDAKVEHSHVHRIPYVIYAPVVGMRKNKLSHKTPISNLYVAGDWTIWNKLQTMEAAVSSGYSCADIILSSINTSNS